MSSFQLKLTPFQLEQYLHGHIPLSKAMQVEVVTADEGAVVLAAPLAPNINHRDTAFGGSVASLATLSAWSLLHLRLTAAGISCRLVIHRNNMEYRRPIGGRFTARAVLDDGKLWEQFTNTLTRRGKARIRVSATVEYAAEVAGQFAGDFVALAGPPHT